jgi:hypothetical protein
VATNTRKSARHNTRSGPKKYGRKPWFTWNSTFEDFQGFLVTEKRTQQMGALEG